MNVTEHNSKSQPNFSRAVTETILKTSRRTTGRLFLHLSKRTLLKSDPY
jgi:hypothetical protein